MGAATRETVRVTTAQALVKYLQVQYSERDGVVRRLVPGVFGIFGHGNVQGIGQALIECGQNLPFLPTRNEQAMVHIAAAYAKSLRRTATYACTASIGPGCTNMVTGAALATVNRLPVLLLPTDYFVSRQQGPVLQQLEHPIGGDISVNDCFRPLSRYFDRISRPEQLLAALPEACRVLTSPAEVGAAVLSLPQDVQSQAFDCPVSFFEENSWRIDRALPLEERIHDAVDLLQRSSRPVIIAGGGVWYSAAEEELLDFALAFGIPVGETFAGKGSMDTEAWVAVGGMGTSGNPVANQVIREADLVICLGTRLTDTQTGSQSLFQNPSVRFISVNVSERDAYKQGALPIVADIRETLRALQIAAKRAGIASHPEYERHVSGLRSDWEATLAASLEPEAGRPISQGEFISILNAWVDPGDTVVAAAGSAPGDLLRIWRTVGARRCYLEFGYSCMTHEIPAGIGVRLAGAGGNVYVVVGDGAFLMNPTEIATAIQMGLKVTIIVSENHGFRSIHGIQMRRTGPGEIGNEFRTLDRETGRLTGSYLPVDLAKIAAGLGAATFRADSADGFRTALERASGETCTCVIVVETDPDRRLPDSTVWREVQPAEVSSDPRVQQLRTNFEQERALQRYHH